LGKKSVLISAIIILLIVAVFIITYHNTNSNSGQMISNNAPPLKIFGEANIVGQVNNIENQTANIKIEEIVNYTFLDSKEKLIGVGDNINIHFSGIGEENNWNTKLLSVDITFSTKIRCLDGRVNSKMTFTKENCYWEANKEDVVINET